MRTDLAIQPTWRCSDEAVRPHVLTRPFHAIGMFDPLTQVALQLEASEFDGMDLGNAMLDIGSSIVSGRSGPCRPNRNERSRSIHLEATPQTTAAAAAE